MTMEVYLVGGAVRDELLGQIVHERDWVVVGATPHQLIELGYQQVGRDFPVFLHPMTKEEYALARTERKSGVGYHGFECQYSPEVSLEEDLKRRDLTINAMALTDDGHVIDPFGGMRDLKLKKLRHVSEAFIEDPLRVLRVARFMARFHHLGFKIATETKILMRRMVEAHELSYLVPERVWQEWKKSLETQNPECFLQTLYDCGALNRVLPELMILFDAEGLPAWQALASSIQNGASPVISFAVLMMALGDVSVVRALCTRLKIPKEYQHLASLACLWGKAMMHPSELTAESVVMILEQVDAFRRPLVFHQLQRVCEAYQNGITMDWEVFWAACHAVDTNAILKAGYIGATIKKQLHLARINAVDLIKRGRKP